jgi:hypothetical protein
MAGHLHSTVDDRDDVIRKLKDELWMARYVLLRTLPAELYQLLTSYHDSETREKSYRWLDRIAEAIVELAQPLPETIQSWGGSRGMCPVCGDGSSSPYERGFALPEGLRRHLVGYGNTHQCVFTQTALKLARDDWHNRFKESDEKEWRDKQSQLQRRLSTEAMYRIEPFGRPELVDEHIYGPSRTPEQMDKARTRLEALGFRKIVEANVEAWIDERAEWIVYADLRQLGRIDFSVWKKPLPKREPARTYKYRIESFHLLDTWKNDLAAKYASRLPKAS